MLSTELMSTVTLSCHRARHPGLMAYGDRPPTQATQRAPTELSIHQQQPYRLPKIEPALRETSPYRLPRIEPEDRVVAGSYKMWSRHGYKVYNDEYVRCQHFVI